jgi:hypothetical protein
MPEFLEPVSLYSLLEIKTGRGPINRKLAEWGKESVA